MPTYDEMTTAQGRYKSLETERDPYRQRAEDAARLTIPAVMPPQGTNGAMLLHQPFQSVGARGVNNLASKILLALFPPGSAFFRLKPARKVIDEMIGQGLGDQVEEIEIALSRVERTVMDGFEAKSARAAISEALVGLIVGGNSLFYIGPKGTFKYFPLSRYVVKRDLEGHPCEIITVEGLAPSSLTKAAKAIYEAKASKENKSDQRTCDIYTRVYLEENRWEVYQELYEEKIPGSEGSYPKDKPAWLPLRWKAVAGEDYGRGLVEEYIGDLRSLEAITQAIVEFAAAASKILFMVDEGGVTMKQTLQDAPSGSVVDGNAKDVTVLQLEKFADFQVVQTVGAGIEKRLEQAFLLNTSVQRQAERVTAEEIRFVAGELEQALGGVYSVLAQELQRPLVERLMVQMMKDQELPSIPDKSINPVIVTGLEGLGRSHDLMKLDIWQSGMLSVVPPEQLAEYIHVGKLGLRRAAALGIDIEGVIRTDEEVDQIRQAAQQAELQKAAVSPTINAMSAQKLQADELQQTPQGA